MKKSILYKEKTNKMYLLMLCGLLVSGAIVCSTNDNGDNGNGDGNGNPLMFACPNGAAVMATADNMPTAAGEENCASCDPGFGDVMQGERTVCQPEFVCPNGTEITDTRPAIAMAGVENCADCNGVAGFMLEDVAGEDRRKRHDNHGRRRELR